MNQCAVRELAAPDGVWYAQYSKNWFGERHKGCDWTTGFVAATGRGFRPNAKYLGHSSTDATRYSPEAFSGTHERVKGIPEIIFVISAAPRVPVKFVWQNQGGRTVIDCIPTESGLDTWRTKIKSFLTLSRGWDSYDAAPPSEQAVDAALKIVDQLGELGLEPMWIVPTSDDSILLQFDCNGNVFKWEAESDGDIGVMMQAPESEPQYFDLAIDKIPTFFEEHCNVVS